jgi:hypothetical protein
MTDTTSLTDLLGRSLKALSAIDVGEGSSVADGAATREPISRAATDAEEH